MYCVFVDFNKKRFYIIIKYTFEFDQVEISMVYPHLKPHILFNSNGLAIWLSDIMHITKIMADNLCHFGRHDLVSVRILPNFELIRAISEVDIWYKFWSDT